MRLCFGKPTKTFIKPSSRWQLLTQNKALQCHLACKLDIGDLNGTRLYAFLQLQAPRSLPRRTALACPFGPTLTLSVGLLSVLLLLGGYNLVLHVFAGPTDLFPQTCLSHLLLVNLQGLSTLVIATTLVYSPISISMQPMSTPWMNDSMTCHRSSEQLGPFLTRCLH